MKQYVTMLLVLTCVATASGGEKSIVALWDFSRTELKSEGIELPRQTKVRITARGGGGDWGWTYRSDDLFAYGWIIDARSRQLVWRMDAENTSRVRDNREYEGTITLEPGSYEVYFTAHSFTHHTTFSHFTFNIDHRQKPLFGTPENKKDFFSYLKGWWSSDMKEEWEKRSPGWGIELFVDEGQASGIGRFTPPRELPDILFKAVRLGDNERVVQGFSLAEPVTVTVYALGEAPGDNSIVDYGWIVDTRNRTRVWEMAWGRCEWAGGAKKNVQYSREVSLDKGDYVLYYITDDSHSAADWNTAPPRDPYNWGITITAGDPKARSAFTKFRYHEDEQVIVRLTKMRDNESRTEGFALKEESRVRVYAIGERSNMRRHMADYGYIMDPITRKKLWSMDVDRTSHAGGASKNRYIDEVITLPKGNYIVGYVTDDSHAYGEWNAAPPFDPERYGITVMGFGPGFSRSRVGRYVEERDRNILAQIVGVGDNVNREERFRLDHPTRVRIYCLGEGLNREMYDYGLIENARTGSVVWEMTYSMTFHAGGHRKNRIVNTTILLDKGEYRLRYRSDDSHSFGRWNVDPPEDQMYWGITLYRDEDEERSGSPESRPR